METKEILHTLESDGKLIKEAFRRLIEGTCCLGEYDRPYIEELFNNVREAVGEHVAFEEQIFYPRIRQEQVYLMRLEHSRLQELLIEAQFAIEHERGLTFRVLIEKIGDALENHSKIENHILGAFEVGKIHNENLALMLERVSKKIV